MHVGARADRQDRRVPLPRGALGRGLRRAIDVHLPPVGGAPEQVLPDRDRVDAAGRKGLVARREQTVADAHAVRRRGDRVAERLDDAVDEVGADTEQRGDDAEEGEELARQGRGDEAADEQQDEEEEPGAQNRRREEAERGSSSRPRWAGRCVGSSSGAMSSETRCSTKLPAGRRGGRIRPRLRAGCAAQDLAAQRVRVRARQVVELHVAVVARDADLEPRGAEQAREEAAARC